MNLKQKGLFSHKELKYFTYEFKKSNNLGNLYLLPKIHKRLSAVPGRPVIPNCGKLTEKASEFVFSALDDTSSVEFSLKCR